MRLLIITQSLDEKNPTLGFFVRWVREFAKHCESIIVICLEKGEYNLPDNVRVLSLGKERNNFQFSIFNFQSILNLKIFKRIKYIFIFYHLLFTLRKQYDSVFVHMNQEYILLAGDIWRLLGKKVYLWRNHAKGGMLTRIAVMMSSKVFYTSPKSFTAQFSNSVMMPVGIDTDFFKPDSSVEKIPNSILFLGRIAPVKKVLEFIEAINELNNQGHDFKVTIAGGALSKDKEYEKHVHDKVAECGLEDKINFVGAVTQSGALDLYRRHKIYVNLTPSGSMDKTIFEAMACGLVPVVSNEDLMTNINKELITSQDVSQSIKYALEHENDLNFRNYVIENHGLVGLMFNLNNTING